MTFRENTIFDTAGEQISQNYIHNWILHRINHIQSTTEPTSCLQTRPDIWWVRVMKGWRQTLSSSTTKSNSHSGWTAAELTFPHRDQTAALIKRKAHFTHELTLWHMNHHGQHPPLYDSLLCFAGHELISAAEAFCLRHVDHNQLGEKRGKHKSSFICSFMATTCFFSSSRQSLQEYQNCPKAPLCMVSWRSWQTIRSLRLSLFLLLMLIFTTSWKNYFDMLML